MQGQAKDLVELNNKFVDESLRANAAIMEEAMEAAGNLPPSGKVIVRGVGGSFGGDEAHAGTEEERTTFEATLEAYYENARRVLDVAGHLRSGKRVSRGVRNELITHSKTDDPFRLRPDRPASQAASKRRTRVR